MVNKQLYVPAVMAMGGVKLAYAGLQKSGSYMKRQNMVFDNKSKKVSECLEECERKLSEQTGNKFSFWWKYDKAERCYIAEYLSDENGQKISAEEEGAYRLGMLDKKVVDVTVAVKLEKYSIQI